VHPLSAAARDANVHPRAPAQLGVPLHHFGQGLNAQAEAMRQLIEAGLKRRPKV